MKKGLLVWEAKAIQYLEALTFLQFSDGFLP